MWATICSICRCSGPANVNNWPRWMQCFRRDHVLYEAPADLGPHRPIYSCSATSVTSTSRPPGKNALGGRPPPLLTSCPVGAGLGRHPFFAKERHRARLVRCRCDQDKGLVAHHLMDQSRLIVGVERCDSRMIFPAGTPNSSATSAMPSASDSVVNNAPPARINVLCG